MLVTALLCARFADPTPDREHTIPRDLVFLARHQAAAGSWGPLPESCRCPRTPSAAPGKSVEALLLQLGHPDLEDRHEAERDLAAWGRAAAPQLREAERSRDPEIAARCRSILGGVSQHAASDTELTGLALLAFLGAGYPLLASDSYEGIRFGEVVRKGLQWLTTIQGPDGTFDAGDPIANTVAALALSEAYGLTGAPHLKEPALRGLAALDRLPPVDPRHAAWRILAARSGELSQLRPPDSASPENIRRVLGPRGGAPLLLLEHWHDLRTNLDRARDLARPDPLGLDLETLLFTAAALRCSLSFTSPEGKEWAATVRRRSHPAPSAKDPVCGGGPWGGRSLRARLREAALHSLVLQAAYRYTFTLVEILATPPSRP